MSELKNVMKEEKRNLLISIVCIVVALLISLLFARGMEGKTFLFHLLETIGGHELALETNMFGMVAVTIIFILYLIHKAFYEKLHYLGIRYKILKYSVFMMLGVSIALNLLAGTVQKGLIRMDSGLDTVFDKYRIGNNNCGFDYDEDGDPTSYGHRVNLINYGSEEVSFHLRFIDLNNHENTYLIKDEKGAPIEITLKPGESWEKEFRISEINPDFHSDPEKGIKRQRYYVEIYNTSESHTFITYD